MKNLSNMSPYMYGIGALFGFGFSSFFVSKVSAKMGGAKSAIFAQVTFLIFVFFLIPVLGLSRFYLSEFLILAIPGVLCALGILFYTTAFSKGAVAIVTPVASSWALITSTLSIVFLDENVTYTTVGGILLTTVGVAVVSTDFDSLFKSKKVKLLNGVKWASLTALTWGVTFFLQAKVSQNAESWFMVLIEMRIWIVLTLIILLPFLKVNNLFEKLPLKLLFFTTVFDMFAVCMFNIGLTTNKTSVVSELSSASPLITITLGVIFNKDKISKTNMFGILTSVAGIVLLSF